MFLEKSTQQLERERSEFAVRATMAEEQLKNFQELMNLTSQQYQKKILELNKRVKSYIKRYHLFSWMLQK